MSIFYIISILTIILTSPIIWFLIYLKDIEKYLRQEKLKNLSK